MYAGIASSVVGLSGLFERIIDEVSAEQRRQHELKLKELSIIENSSLRDEFVAQLLLDRVLAPIESAQHDIQNAAKHAQWLAEIVNYYFHDHGLSEEQGHELAAQFRQMAIAITKADSLHDLKQIYAAVSLFSDHASAFKHRTREYRLENTIRQNILNRLNTCIATEKNFQRRSALMSSMQPKAISDRSA